MGYCHHLLGCFVILICKNEIFLRFLSAFALRFLSVMERPLFGKNSLQQPGEIWSKTE